MVLSEFHEQAAAANAKHTKENVEGTSDLSLEEPLDNEIVDGMLDEFEKDHGYRLDESELLWAHLLGPIYREKEKNGVILSGSSVSAQHSRLVNHQPPNASASAL